jgi:hypothetical protein
MGSSILRILFFDLNGLLFLFYFHFTQFYNSFLFHNLLINKYVIINQEKTELVALAIFNFFHLAFLFLYLMFKYFL